MQSGVGGASHSKSESTGFPRGTDYEAADMSTHRAIPGCIHRERDSVLGAPVLRSGRFEGLHEGCTIIVDAHNLADLNSHCTWLELSPQPACAASRYEEREYIFGEPEP